MASKQNETLEAVLEQAQAPVLTAPKTAAQVMSEANIELTKAEGRRKALVKHYTAEEKVPMYLSPMYRAYFGNVMTVTVNGISIYFKVDGSTQMVPETFADEITRRRLSVDGILTKQNKMADVSANVDSAPGELKLF